MLFHERNLITPDVQRCNNSKRCLRNHLKDKGELYFSIGRKLAILIEFGLKAQVLSVASLTHRSQKQIVPAHRKECLELPDCLYTSQSSIKREFLSLFEHWCWPFDWLARLFRQHNLARSKEDSACEFFSLNVGMENK